jgi:metal-responsive CopG/Arc/MetJ family transcriptional regulator
MQISIYMPARLLALVDLHAKRRSLSRSGLITAVMRKLVDEAEAQALPHGEEPEQNQG